ncbi:MAG: DUF1838 family protein [Deltaproteobacteria bacterium]|nr:DUF1838 family protein [Deltaproteobacteria bacterium]
MRCALDGHEVVMTWTGSVYAVVPGERQRRLFGVVGLNIARCLLVDGRWHLTSRELLYYLDPTTGAPLHRWTNPWTSAEVAVVHVANERVQNVLAGPVPMTIADGTATIAFDIPLFYPNPLASDPATRSFDPNASYQAAELFAFAMPAEELAKASAARLWFTWHRIGPWLPWMGMGERPGVLLYSTRGRKVAAWDELPRLLRDEISTRVPLYRHAPACVLPGKNETSWTYFARNVLAYQAGERFPIAAPVNTTECR